MHHPPSEHPPVQGTPGPHWAPDGDALVPVCRLGHDGDRLEVRLRLPAGPGRRLVIKLAAPDRLTQLVHDHRRHLTAGDEAPLPVSATAYFLDRIHHLVAGHLVDLLGGLPRVALDLHGWLLPLLPLETAHRPGSPALFEVTQCFRLPPRPLSPPPGRRRFRLHQLPAAMASVGGPDLPAVPLERDLVASAHDRHRPVGDRIGGDHRLVHLAGHRPRVPDGALQPFEQAHVVLSGCDSLPRHLPPGAGSVVGSLWPVDDQQSTSFMAHYHGRLALGVGPLDALRQTQLAHRTLPPEVWAAYAYLGHPD